MLNDLMNNGHCSVRFLEPELQWSETRVNHGPLTRPTKAAPGTHGISETGWRVPLRRQ